MPSIRMPIVALTNSHSVTGTVILRDQRLSDLLNDRRDSVIQVFEATVTGNASARKIQESKNAVLSKDNIVLLFEQSDVSTGSLKRPYAYTLKQRHDVFLISQGIEIRGTMYSKGDFDVVELHRLIATSGERFVPVTEARIALPSGQVFTKKAGVLVNAAHVNFISKADQVAPSPAPS